MNFFWRLVATGIAVVLAFDVAAALASVLIGYPYEYASAGSVLIYATAGYRAFRGAGLKAAIGAALCIEAADATLGWALSWWIGPGALPEDQRTTLFIAVSIAFAFLFAALCAGGGAGLARLIGGPRRSLPAG